MENAPKAFGPGPSERQLAWHKLETYGFIHFTVNTFTDKEWGYGDESPAIFSPSDFDADQIAEAAAAGGLAGLVLTAKHHDGFCLWPSRYTDHSVRRSPFRGGEGDVVRELSDACRTAGLQFGLYLSPWDRNHTHYAGPQYVEYYQNQLRELMSEYGPLFEVWFDGANGGDGYYGGAREARKIDPHTYYRWDETWDIVRRLQPGACMFSDVGPDIRWVGNERGVAGDPCWHRMDRSRFSPGDAKAEVLNAGLKDGPDWLPAECDVSIRPGWFYHEAEDEKVRSPENLLDLYYKSVGRGASLHLNLPPDRRGLIHEVDARALREFRQRLDRIFSEDLARGATITADGTRPGRFGIQRLTDGDAETFWTTEDDSGSVSLTLQFGDPVTFSLVGLREYLPLGQRVDTVSVTYDDNGTFREFARTTGVGNRMLLSGPRQRTRTIRINFENPMACPCISEVTIHNDAEAPSTGA